MTEPKPKHSSLNPYPHCYWCKGVGYADMMMPQGYYAPEASERVRCCQCQRSYERDLKKGRAIFDEAISA